MFGLFALIDRTKLRTTVNGATTCVHRGQTAAGSGRQSTFSIMPDGYLILQAPVWCTGSGLRESKMAVSGQRVVPAIMTALDSAT
jgi:hypothetical protein